MTEKYLLVFDSTHNAISSQKALRDFNVTIIPTPSEISLGCGISILLSEKYLKQAIELVKNLGIENSRFKIYKLENDCVKKYTLQKADIYE